jgi:hypothetical protein
VGLLDGVYRKPLRCVWQKELVDDLYLVIGGLDGSESLRRRHLMLCDAIDETPAEPSTNPNPTLQDRPLAKVRGCQFDDEFGYLLRSKQTMTRGRRKDTTLPPSRPLIIQRAYRDRKAKHLADLEDRCRKAEEENERLRNELELARSESAASVINSELVSATFSGKRKTNN